MAIPGHRPSTLERTGSLSSSNGPAPPGYLGPAAAESKKHSGQRPHCVARILESTNKAFHSDFLSERAGKPGIYSRDSTQHQADDTVVVQRNSLQRKQAPLLASCFTRVTRSLDSSVSPERLFVKCTSGIISSTISTFLMIQL